MEEINIAEFNIQYASFSFGNAKEDWAASEKVNSVLEFYHKVMEVLVDTLIFRPGGVI